MKYTTTEILYMYGLRVVLILWSLLFIGAVLVYMHNGTDVTEYKRFWDITVGGLAIILVLRIIK